MVKFYFMNIPRLLFLHLHSINIKKFFVSNNPHDFLKVDIIWHLCITMKMGVITHIASPWSLQWHHNKRDGITNQQPHHCLFNRLFRHRSKKTSKLRVNGLCVENSPVAGEFPAQRASNAENVSIWWRHHGRLWARLCAVGLTCTVACTTLVAWPVLNG